MDFKKIIPHLVAVAVFYAMAAFFFTPQFQGKSLGKGDLRAGIGSGKETIDLRARTGEPVLWNNSLFAGMPNYQAVPAATGNHLPRARPLLYGFMNRPAGLVFAGMLGCYLLLIIAGVNPWLGIVGALATGLATNGFVLVKAGQYAKITTVLLVPLVAAGILLAYRKYYVLGGLLFAFAMGLTLYSNHPQMLYYFAMTLPLYGIGRFLLDRKREQTGHFLKATGALVIGFLLGIGANATNIITTLEYAPQTMRGGQLLEEPVRTSKDGPAVAADGLEWDYAMQWSNGLIDLVGTFTPLAAGGGNGTEIENGTPLGQAMRRQGYQMPKTFAAPTYFGALPFTEGPQYAGAVVWALFIFGLFTARGHYRLWLGGGMVLLFAISMGKNLQALNQPLFNFLPLMKSFRAPNAAISYASFLMVTLGVLGVHNWLSTLAIDPDKARRQLLYAGGAAVAVGLLVTILLPMGLTYANPGDASIFSRMYGITPQNPTALTEALIDTRRELYASSAWRSFLYTGLCFGVLFLLFRKTVSPLVGAIALGLLVVVDFAGVNERYLSEEDWQRTVRRAEADFPQTPADQAILSDEDPHYRVFNTTVSTFNDATTSFYHHSIGGYNAVKMRRIQDVIDAFFLPRDENNYTYNYPRRNDQAILDMLNTRYFIVRGQDGQPQAQRNPNAYGNAWLASDIAVVGSSSEEFRRLATEADLKSTAIIHEEFSDVVAGLDPTGEGTVSLTGYNPDEMTYRFDSPSDQLVVFSETYYGPDLGWTVTIDGQEAPLIRANYLLRAVRVPAGQHTIVMRFRPGSYFLGRTLATVCSLLILLGLIAYGGYSLWRARAAGQRTEGAGEDH